MLELFLNAWNYTCDSLVKTTLLTYVRTQKKAIGFAMPVVSFSLYMQMVPLMALADRCRQIR